MFFYNLNLKFLLNRQKANYEKFLHFILKCLNKEQNFKLQVSRIISFKFKQDFSGFWFLSLLGWKKQKFFRNSVIFLFKVEIIDVHSGLWDRKVFAQGKNKFLFEYKFFLEYNLKKNIFNLCSSKAMIEITAAKTAIKTFQFQQLLTAITKESNDLKSAAVVNLQVFGEIYCNAQNDIFLNFKWHF